MSVLNDSSLTKGGVLILHLAHVNRVGWVFIEKLAIKALRLLFPNA